MTFDNPSHPLNDNVQRRGLYRKSDFKGSQERFLPFLPVARYIIKTYLAEPWKNDLDDPEYIFVEYQICSTLETSHRSKETRDFNFRMLAATLKIPVLRFLNDEFLISLLETVTPNNAI